MDPGQASAATEITNTARSRCSAMVLLLPSLSRSRGGSWASCRTTAARLAQQVPRRASFSGTAAWVTSRSPAPAAGAGHARLLTRKVRPFWVPAGTLRVTGPSRVGTLSSVPRAASAKVTGTVMVRSWLLRPNSGCGVTRTLTIRSPAGAPAWPGSPWPFSRTVAPSLTPTGIRTRSSRVRTSSPAAVAGRAGVVDQRAAALAGRAGAGEAEQALVAGDRAPAVAGRAGPGQGAGLGPGAVAGVAGGGAAQLQGGWWRRAPPPRTRVASLSTSRPRLAAVWDCRPPPNRFPNRSPRPPKSSTLTRPPPGTPPPPPGNPPKPPPKNAPEASSRRASSYSARFLGSDSTA